MYCPHCGIEVMEVTETCPICKQGLSPDKIPLRPVLYPIYKPKERGTSLSRRYGAAGIVFFVFLVPAMVSTLTDYFLNGSLSWSILVLLSLAMVVGVSIMGILLYRLPVVGVIGSFLWIGGFFLVINFYLGGHAWALFIATPITLLILVIILVFWGIRVRFNPSGLVQIGIFFVLLSGLVIGIEVFINGFLLELGYILPDLGWMGMIWSPIVSGVLMPLSGVFFMIHWIMMKSEKARKFFHW